MALDWTEKYRPQGLDGVLGNKNAIYQLQQWARSWEEGKPEKKAVILAGDPGLGKTSSALALAHDFGWGVIELNASDARNAEAIRKVATSGAVNETFTESGDYISSKSGGRKLILLDEADNVFGREDQGGMQQIVETIRETKQPIILIANDYYALTRRSPALKFMCITIRYSAVQASVMKGALRRICSDEGLEVADEALEKIAERSNGDMRSAINDLQALAEGKTRLTREDADALGYRDPRMKMYDAMKVIFEGRSVYRAKEVTTGLDEEPDFIMLWVDENLPYAYRNPEDLYEGFRALSKADMFMSWVNRRQYYGFWSYALDMMTAGVAMKKKKSSFVRGAKYNFPGWLMRMKQSKENRRMLDGTLGKIAKYCHTSKNQVREDMLAGFKELFVRDFKFAVRMTMEMELERDDVAFLINEKSDSKEVKTIIDEAAKLAGDSPEKNVRFTGLEGLDLHSSQPNHANGIEDKGEKASSKDKDEDGGEAEHPQAKNAKGKNSAAVPDDEGSQKRPRASKKGKTTSMSKHECDDIEEVTKGHEDAKPEEENEKGVPKTDESHEVPQKPQSQEVNKQKSLLEF